MGIVRKAGIAFGLLSALVLVGLFNAPHRALATSGVPYLINFQGKVTNLNGTNVSNGSYSFVFKIYNASSGGSALWTETQSLTTTDGIFQANLDSVAANNFSGVDFGTFPLYLGVSFNGDPEMSPRIQLTSAPYALNADKLGDISASGFVQLGPAAAQQDSSTNSSIFINKTGASGNILQLQNNNGGSPINVFTVSNTGNVTVQSQTNSSGAFAVQNAGGTTLLNFDTTPSNVSLNENVGNINILGVANPATPTLTTTGTTGTLAAGTYLYQLAAQGKTGVYTTAEASSPTSVTTTGSTSKNTLTWTGVPFATGYIVYRSINGGANWFTNTVAAGTTSLVDNGSTFTWATPGTPQSYNATGGFNIQDDTFLTFDGGTGSFNASVHYQSLFNQLVFGNYNSGGSLVYQADSLKFQDSTAFATEFSVNNTGQTVFENRTDSGTAFEIQNHNASSNLFVADTSHSEVGIGRTPSGSGATLQVSGTTDSTTGFSFNGTGGSTVTCSSGNYLNSQVVQGGIITSGTCASAGGGTVTLQSAYTADSAGNDIVLDTTRNGIQIQNASGTPVTGDLFDLQNNGATVTYFGVSTTTLSITDGITQTGGVVSLTGNGGSQFVTTSGNLLLDATSGSTPSINIGTGGQAKTIQIGNTASAVTQNINIGNNNTASSTTNVVIGAGTSATGGTTTLQSKGTLTINSGTGTVTLGTNTSGLTFSNSGTGSITSTSGQALTVTGNAASTWSTSAGLLTIQGGGGLTLNGAGTTAASLDTTGAGTVNVGASNAATINVGNSSTTSIGIGASAASGNITEVTGASGTINIGTNVVSNTINIGTNGTNTGNTQNINLGATASAGTTNVSIGASTGATGGTTTINSIGALTIQTANASGGTILMQGGTGSTAVLLQTGQGGGFGLGANPVSNTIQIGTNATNTGNTQTISVGATGSAGTTNVTVGASTGATAGTTLIQSKSGTTIDSGNGTILIGTNTTTLQKAATAFSLDLTNASNSTLTVTNSGAGTASLTVEAGINAGTGYSFNTTPGSTVTCGSGNYLNSQVVQGGIITSGTCAAAGGGSGTLQNGYDNSTGSTTPEIKLNNGGTDTGGIQITDNATPISGDLFDIQNAAQTSTYLGVSTARVSVGSIGTATGQLYVSGQIPTAGLGSVSLSSQGWWVRVVGRYAYVLVNNNANNFKIYDVTNPASPSLISSTTFTGGAQDFYISGHYLYIPDVGTDSLYIYDISNPFAPSLVSTTSTGAASDPLYAYGSGKYLYITLNATSKVATYDVSNPAAPALLSSVSTSLGGAGELVVQGRYLYVQEDAANQELQIYDLTNPASPSSVSATNTGVSAAEDSLWVQGKYVYIINGSANTIQVWDVSNPASPASAGSALSLGASNGPQDISVQGRYAYIADTTSAKLQIVDISNPASLASVGTVSTNTGPKSVTVSGRYAYVGTGNGTNVGTLQTFDLGGAYVQQLEVGGTETGTLQVDSNATFNNDANVQGGLTVGQNTQLNGDLGVNGVATFASRTNSPAALTLDDNTGNTVLGAGTTSTNQILNGSFESNITGWSLRGSASALTQDTSQAVSGTSSFQYRITTTTADGVKYSLPSSPTTLMTNGVTYTFSFYARATAGSTSIIAGHADNGSTETTCSVSPTGSLPTTGWNRYSCTFAAGPQSGIPYVFIGDAASAFSIINIDSVQLVASSNLTPFGVGTTQLNGVINAATTFQNGTDSVNAFQVQNAAGTSNLLVADTFNSKIGILGTPSSSGATVQVTGNINASTGYQFNGTGGSTVTCSSGNYLNTEVVQGGIITGGSCSAVSGGSTSLQTAYNNATAGTTPEIVLASSSNGIQITNSSGGVSGDLFDIQNNAQTTTYLGVSTTGVSIGGGLTQTGGAVSIQGNAASSLTTTSGALTITSAAGATFSTAAGTLTLQGGGAVILNAASGSSIQIGDSTNNMTLAATTREPTLNGSARHLKYIQLSAEFPGATLTGDGTGNTGTMTSDNETTSPFRNYYDWTSATSGNDYDIWIKVPLPDDFSAWSGSGGTATGFGTASADTVSLQFYDTTNTSVCTTTDIVTASGWNSNVATCNYTTGTFTTGGNFFTIDVKLTVGASNDHARIANIEMPYLSKY
jgi:hypothetical protein